MDRYWLLSCSTYGSWLPGDERGFVSAVRDKSGQRTIHNVPGTPYDADLPALKRHAQTLLKGEVIRFTLAHAELLWTQFLETADYRGWQLLAVGIMANHIHLVVGVPGDPDPGDILGDFKSYGSRTLNQRWGKPASGTWWVAKGSKRKLPDEDAVLAAVKYVLEQEYPLLLWTAAIPELAMVGGRVV
jgi:REP element-mobilizing transposase RayT